MFAVRFSKVSSMQASPPVGPFLFWISGQRGAAFGLDSRYKRRKRKYQVDLVRDSLAAYDDHGINVHGYSIAMFSLVASYSSFSCSIERAFPYDGMAHTGLAPFPFTHSSYHRMGQEVISDQLPYEVLLLEAAWLYSVLFCWDEEHIKQIDGCGNTPQKNIRCSCFIVHDIREVPPPLSIS